MPRTAIGQQKYFFSEKLKAQLGQLSQYPLTVIEAPSGFGKTTAIKEYLRTEFPQAYCEWYTCLGESAFSAWMGICELFAKLNSKVADGMKNLSVPTADTLFYMKAYLKRLACKEKTFLIIDNYHLINFDIHRELIDVFSMHENPNLHLIVITQQLNSREQLSVHNNNIFSIDASSFFFDRESISGLFRMEGFRLMPTELDHIIRSTEGWISAIRLQMLHYSETGSFLCLAGIEQLVETTIWNRLLPIEKEFLLRVSVFDSFTARQAAAMLEYEILPGEIEAQLKTSDFIRFLPDQRLFVIHNILLDYLRSRFYYYQPKEYQSYICRKAGMSCAGIGQYCLAAKFFYQVRDFEALFSLPFTRQYLDAHKDECDKLMFYAIVQDCPDEVLCKYPSTMIIFAHYALLNGQHGLYETLCKLLHTAIQKNVDLPTEERRKFIGELILLESLGSFNNLSEMRNGIEAASEMLGELPGILENSMPWFSVFPTTYGMFWRESGKLDEVLNTIDELKPIYQKFSRGHGTGLASLIRAETMIARGAAYEAEILCHKTLLEARAQEQISICIYAELTLARIFILRKDAEQFSARVKAIQAYGAQHANANICRMVDMCMSIISLSLGVSDYIAPWLYSLESIRASLYAPVIPFAEILHFRLLLLKKRYSELLAACQLALDAIETSDSKIIYRMLKMYYFIFLALAKHHHKDDLEAARYLKEALAIALPDQIYLPFAEQERMEELLLQETIRCFCNQWEETKDLAGNLGTLSQNEAEKSNPFNQLISLCRQQTIGSSMIRKTLMQHKSPLTPREREIALLAKARMSAKEIASKLYISEKTVKSTLGNVYSKLGIHSKSELAAREF